MPESEFLSGKKTLERRAVAKALLWARGMDSGKFGTYCDNVDLSQYLVKLQGLTAFMDYIRKLRVNGVVLDIGAGTTRAVSQLEKSPLGRDLSFRATVLSRDPRIEDNLGFDRVIQTEVERLKGIEDQSVSGVISRTGIEYSANPQAAIASINRILIPGGAIKACFSHESIDFGQTHDRFSDALLDLGYDVAISPTYTTMALLAIKPGGNLAIGVEKLMGSDNGSRDYLAMFSE